MNVTFDFKITVRMLTVQEGSLHGRRTLYISSLTSLTHLQPPLKEGDLVGNLIPNI